MSVTDDFNRSNGSLGANWTDQAFQGSHPEVFSNGAWNNQASAFGAVYWGANSFNAAQSSQIKIITSTNYVAAGVRHSSSGSSTNFYAYFSHGSLQKFVSGTQTAFGTAPPAGVVNGTIKLDVTWNGSTNTLTPIKDGTPQTTSTDSALPGTTPGAAGIAWFANTAGADDWIGTGEISGGAATSIPATVGMRAVVLPARRRYF